MIDFEVRGATSGGYFMNSKKNVIKLYNVMFPLWMFMLFPVAWGVWLIILPGNFIIDSLVLIIGMLAFKIPDKKQFYKKHILKAYGFGWLSDIIGELLALLIVILLKGECTGDELYITCPGLLLSALMIFVFNYFITFKRTDKKIRLGLSVLFAVATAPYTFLVPLDFMWSLVY